MIMSYNEAIAEYGNAYQIEKKIKLGELHKIENGVYSDSNSESEIAIITKKYPKGIITGENAFYYHELTDVIPEKYFIATSNKSAPISDKRVHQIYIDNKLLLLGATYRNIDGVDVKIYDKERMLIELLRNKNKLPYDYYKEILYNYRKIIDSLEIWRIQEYAKTFPKSKMICKALDEEVL